MKVLVHHILMCKACEQMLSRDGQFVCCRNKSCANHEVLLKPPGNEIDLEIVTYEEYTKCQ